MSSLIWDYFVCTCFCCLSNLVLAVKGLKSVQAGAWLHNCSNQSAISNGKINQYHIKHYNSIFNNKGREALNPWSSQWHNKETNNSLPASVQTWPRGYKTWVHFQNQAQWLAACRHVYASSQSLHFILSLRLYSRFITARPNLDPECLTL